MRFCYIKPSKIEFEHHFPDMPLDLIAFCVCLLSVGLVCTVYTCPCAINRNIAIKIDLLLLFSVGVIK